MKFGVMLPHVGAEMSPQAVVEVAVFTDADDTVFSPFSGGVLDCSVPCASRIGTMGEQDVGS
jgi:hypothetical protein